MSTAMKRVEGIIAHLQPATSSLVAASPASSENSEDHKEEKAVDLYTDDVTPSTRHWNGWGFSDTEFYLNESGQVALSGKRYMWSGKEMPSLRSWMEQHAGLDINLASPSQDHPKAPPAVVNEAFLRAVRGQYRRLSHTERDRVFHAHGHTAQEVFRLRFSGFARVPDVVIWPGSHEQVEAIVRLANEHDVVIIPFGGGTSVSQALICPEGERRMIVSLDMHEMNRIKWVNKTSMLACVEAGIVGRELEAKLKSLGVVIGHEPDSIEFSTLGGWVATRASGMRKNKYGNIEDIVVQVKMVTPTGTVEKDVQAPRVSTGPDVNHLILGSEGALGVVTEVVIRLRPPPPVTRYGSVLLPSFEQGVAFMHEIAMLRAAPVSIRLVDNTQFQFAQALKPAADSKLAAAVDKIKKWYVTQALKFDVNSMVAATLLFEGTKAEVDAQEKKVYEVAAKYGGMKAGEENGVRGYFLTYMIAYLRDFGMNYSFVAESFETSVAWDKVQALCASVKDRIREVAKEWGVRTPPFVSCRVTQTYDTGACVYFYFGFVWAGLPDAEAAFAAVEHEAREEILRCGGSLSHHHGVGKLRKGWMTRTVSPLGMQMLRAVKQTVDPKNIFANGNLGLLDDAPAH